MLIVNLLLCVLAFMVAIPVAGFVGQVACAFLPKAGKRRVLKLGVDSVCKVAVLIPAHNESVNLLPTLDSIKAQANSHTRVVVVADNCNDDTAELARAAGVDVIERFHATERGKGYALDFGIRYLSENPPDVLVILDADCLLEADALPTLVRRAELEQRPVQALYLMYNKGTASLKAQVAEFAWVVKNWVRPRGLHALGLPCQLMGSGMAFPWSLMKHVNLASGHIVEDMKLGADFASAGFAPVFCEEALVTSYFPENTEGAASQRTRWEHGHLAVMLKEAPRLLLKSLAQANVHMMALALDICIPPLALLIMVLGVLLGFGVLLALVSGTAWFFGWMVLSLVLVGTAVLMAWARWGRHILSFSTLMWAPVYVLMKLPLYVKFLVGKQVEWVRSKRDR